MTLTKRLAWFGMAFLMSACARPGDRESKAPEPAAGTQAVPSADAPTTEGEMLIVPAEEADPAVVEALRAAYPMTTCPVSGRELGSAGEPYEVIVDGRLVRFCTAHCLMRFELEPDVYLARIDSAAAARGGS